MSEKLTKVDNVIDKIYFLWKGGGGRGGSGSGWTWTVIVWSFWDRYYMQSYTVD